MKKLLILLLVLSLGIGSLASCRGDTASSSSKAASVTGTASNTDEQTSVDSVSETESDEQSQTDTSSEESAVSSTDSSTNSSSKSNSSAASSKTANQSSAAASSAAGTSSATAGATTPTGKTYTPAAKSLSGTISMSGSTSVYPATAALTEAFKKLYPKVKISITNVTGSGAGLSDANNKKVTFGMRSSEWDESTAKSNSNIVAHTIALDGVALVVNTANPLDDITGEQLFSIYKPGSTVTNWKDIIASYDKPISAVSRESGSGTRTCFQDVMKGLKFELKSGYDTNGNSDIAASTDSVKTKVKGNANAIGYMSLGSVDSSVKKLKFNGVEATEANVISGDYKFSRPFLLLSNKTRTMNDAEKEFLKFALSKDGQEIIKKGGFINLDDASITKELAKIG